MLYVFFGCMANILIYCTSNASQRLSWSSMQSFPFAFTFTRCCTIISEMSSTQSHKFNVERQFSVTFRTCAIFIFSSLLLFCVVTFQISRIHQTENSSDPNPTEIVHPPTQHIFIHFISVCFRLCFLFQFHFVGRLIEHTRTHRNQHISGVSGFDSSGHGHYYANNQNNPAQSPYHQQQPSLPSSNPHQQSPPRPFQHSSQTPNAPPPQYNTHHPQQSYGSQSNSESGNSGIGGSSYNSNKGGSSAYAGGWNYVSGNDRNNQHHSQANYGHGQGQDKDTPQR